MNFRHYHFDKLTSFSGRIRHFWTHQQYQTTSFIPKRAHLHQQCINRLFEEHPTCNLPTLKPKGILVIGGRGSGKSSVVQKLNQENQFIPLDRHFFKAALVEHEHQLKPSVNKRSWYKVLNKEANLVRQEALKQAIHSSKDIIVETHDINIGSIQANIDILLSKGYEVELHLSESSEEQMLARIAKRNNQRLDTIPLSNVRKTIRQAKVAFEEISRINHGRINSQRWSNNSSEPERYQQTLVNQWFNRIKSKFAKDREMICLSLNSHDRRQSHLSDHLNKIERLAEISTNIPSEELLLTLITDIALFPEIYLTYEEELQPLLDLIDKSDFKVYFASVTMSSPVKSHGAVIIASPCLEKGVSLSAAGDTKRGRLKLPLQFRTQLANSLRQIKSEPTIIKKFLGLDTILKQLEAKDEHGHFSTLFFDSLSMTQLVTECAPELIEYYTESILYSPKYHIEFGLNDKPRTSLQKKDSRRFNALYPTFLKEQTTSSFNRALGHIHHGFTRDVAIREQRSAAPSRCLKNWLNLTAHRLSVDESRTLTPGDNPGEWHFRHNTLTHEKGGNCNTISAFILGQPPITASMFNLGTYKAKQLAGVVSTTKRPFDKPKCQYRAKRSGNLYETMIKEAHFAKLVINNPLPYQSKVFKVNQDILDKLALCNSHQLNRISAETQLFYPEFDPQRTSLNSFLSIFLKSSDPKHIYKSLLFHQIFYSVLNNNHDNYKHDSDGYDSATKRYTPPLRFHHGIGLLRNHQLGELNLHQDSFNQHLPMPPASSFSSYGDSHNRYDSRDERVFGYGTCTTVNSLFSTLCHGPLKDDLIGQDNYLMALAAANVYAGHHSYWEMLGPLRKLRKHCPERLLELNQNKGDFYQTVMSRRFLSYVTNETPTSSTSKYHQCLSSIDKDIKVATTMLQKSPVTTSLPANTDVESDRHTLIRLILQKISSMDKSKKSSKYIFLSGISYRLQKLDLTDPSELLSLKEFLSKASDYQTHRFQGLTSFSRFKSTSGNRITETAWLVEQVNDFIEGIIDSPALINQSHLSL